MPQTHTHTHFFLTMLTCRRTRDLQSCNFVFSVSDQCGVVLARQTPSLWHVLRCSPGGRKFSLVRKLQIHCDEHGAVVTAGQDVVCMSVGFQASVTVHIRCFVVPGACKPYCSTGEKPETPVELVLAGVRVALNTGGEYVSGRQDMIAIRTHGLNFGSFSLHVLVRCMPSRQWRHLYRVVFSPNTTVSHIISLQPNGCGVCVCAWMQTAPANGVFDLTMVRMCSMTVSNSGKGVATQTRWVTADTFVSNEYPSPAYIWKTQFGGAGGTMPVPVDG
jgi:hypothetical protein